MKKYFKRKATLYDGDYDDDELETEPVFESDEDYIEEFKIVETFSKKKANKTAKERTTECSLQYQLAEISVYTKFFTISNSGTKIYFNGIVKQYEETNDESDNSIESIDKQSYDEELIFYISDFVKLKIDNEQMAQFVTKNAIRPSYTPGVFNVQVNRILF